MSDENPGGSGASPEQTIDTLRHVKYKYIPNVQYNGFKVMVTSSKNDLDSLEVGEIVKKSFDRNEIRDIRQTGRKSLIIYCEKYHVANMMSEMTTLQNEDRKFFIPLYFTSSCGVIWGINKKYSEEYLMQNIEAGQLKIRKVVRVKRYDYVDGQRQQTAIDTDRVKIYFEGGCIPQYVFINYVRIPCEPLEMKVTPCKICWSYYHGTWQCKNERKCKRCGSPHSPYACEQPMKCPACNGNHQADYINCPEKVRQENINRLVTRKNMSKAEAALYYPHPKKKTDTHSSIVQSNRFSVLDDESDDDFPSLEAASKTRKNKKQKRAQIPVHEAPTTPKLAINPAVATNDEDSTESGEIRDTRRDLRKSQYERKTTRHENRAMSPGENLHAEHQTMSKRDRTSTPATSSNEEKVKRTKTNDGRVGHKGKTISTHSMQNTNSLNSINEESRSDVTKGTQNTTENILNTLKYTTSTQSTSNITHSPSKEDYRQKIAEMQYNKQHNITHNDTNINIELPKNAPKVNAPIEQSDNPLPQRNLSHDLNLYLQNPTTSNNNRNLNHPMDYEPEDSTET